VSSSLAPSTNAPCAEQRAAEALDVETLYRRHAQQVGRWAGRLAGNGTDVEDLVHQVFLVAHRRLADFRGDAKVTTWLHGITVRVVQEARRRQRRSFWPRRRQGTDGEASPADHDPTETLAADEPSALELLERKEAGRVVYEVLNQMDEKYRTTLILFELEGLSGQQVAEVTKTSLSNVWVRLLRGRQQFVKRFRAWESQATTVGPARAKAGATS
jgi:RNA polymerase sigma-70 factor (ECF subfamily)